MNPIIFILIAIAALAMGFLFLGFRARRRVSSLARIPGKMIQVNDHFLHAQIEGSGKPVVVFISGAGGVSLHWARVQPEIAEETTTIAYDRAGLGWSDATETPITFEAMAEELHELLETSALDAPYVIVAHSFGGIVARQFAKHYPEEVVGMVLVDSAYETQFTERFPEPVREMARRIPGMMSNMIWSTRLGMAAMMIDRTPLTPGLPDDLAERERAVRMMGPRHTVAMAQELETFANKPPAPVATLGDMPLVVLTHGEPQSIPSMTPEVNKGYEGAWQEMQLDLAKLSTNSKHTILPGVGHDIHLEDPDTVIDAIKDVLAQVKAVEQ